jgi:hypothetical protein
MDGENNMDEGGKKLPEKVNQLPVTSYLETGGW